jgi:hypothetical protein
MIAVATDLKGLRMAAAELMEDSLYADERERMEKLAETSANPEALLRACQPQRSLPLGYYLWLTFVAEAIEQPLQAGVTFRDADLGAEEITALQILREARAEFRRKHPPCGGCGKPLANEWDKTCSECWAAETAANRGR